MQDERVDTRGVQPDLDPPATSVLVVTEAGLATNGDTCATGSEGTRQRVVVLQPNATQTRSAGSLLLLSNILFGFLAALAFGIAGGIAVAVAGVLGHAVARFVHLRRLCPIAPGCLDGPVHDSSPR